MTNNNDDEGGEESRHVKPAGWRAAWVDAQDEHEPSTAIKKAAERLVWCELFQQSMGWLLLTQIGVLLGSFGQVMSQGVCLLSWGIFTLEAVLKYGRSWAHNHYFRDVPCNYVPIHQDAAHNSLAFFGLFVLAATLLEVSLYVPYIFAVIKFWHVSESCYDVNSECPDGTTRLIEMLIVSMIIVVLHWISSLGVVVAFKWAMGIGITALAQGETYGRKQNKQYLRNTIQRFRRKRNPSHRLLCLTWWVHMARHRHLSAVVASAQPGNCGLPGHWFETVSQLKDDVANCEHGDRVHLDSSAPLSVVQEMALRALMSLAKQRSEKVSEEIVRDRGFLLLVQVVREGKRETCRGLAAAAIAELATQHEALRKANVDLDPAVVPLKRLARSSNVEYVEVAYGALLNCALSNDDASKKVISKLLNSDGMVIGEDESGHNFLYTIIDHAHKSPTTRCQELAVGLLSCLVGGNKQAAKVTMAVREGKVNVLQLCTALLNHGLSAKIQAGAAGVLAELGYWGKDFHSPLSESYSEEFIGALVGGLRRQIPIAFASARALCSIAYKHQATKQRIVKHGGIEALVDLLREKDITSRESFASFSTSNYARSSQLERLGTSDISYLESDDGSIQRNTSLSLGSKELALTMQEKKKEEVRSDAARALRILALNQPEHQKKMIIEGALPLLLEMLRVSTDLKVLVQAISAISALTWKCSEAQDLIGGSEDSSGKFFSRLLEVLARSEKDSSMSEVVWEKGAIAIQSAAEGNEYNRQILLRLEAKERLEEFIAKRTESNEGMPKRLQAVKRALSMLTKEQPS